MFSPSSQQQQQPQQPLLTSLQSLLTEPPPRPLDPTYIPTWRARLGLPPSIPGKPLNLIDIPLAVKILHRSSRWRILVSFLTLQLSILIVLLIYCFYTSQLDVRFWAKTNINSRFVDEPFTVPAIEYDVQGNSTIVFSPDSLTSNFDPFTLNPMPLPPPSHYMNCTLPNGFQISCLPYERLITFKTIRSWNDFIVWFDKILIVDAIVTETESYPPFLTGAVRVRQVRSQPCPSDYATSLYDAFQVNNTNTQCYPGAKNWIEETTPVLSSSHNDSAFYYSSASQLSMYQSAKNPNQMLQGDEPPAYLSTYYDILYPNGGYMFQLNRCDSTGLTNRARWAQLVQNEWILPGSTRAIFITMDLYDPILALIGVITFTIEFYPEGGNVIPSAYTRFVPVPRTTNSSAIIRYVLVSLSILYILATVFRTGLECHRYRRRTRAFGFSPFWRLLDLCSMICIQTALWLAITVSLSPLASALSDPQTLGLVTSCNYTSFVDGTAAMVFNNELINLLLSFALLLTGFQMFRIGQLYSRLAIPFSIMEKARYELIGFFILFVSLIFFFAVGGTYIFGSHSTNFYTIWASIVNVIMVSSNTHQVSAIAVNGIDVAFRSVGLTSSPSDYFNSIIAETTFLRKYELSPLLSASVFYGFLLVIMMFFLQNVLLGIVLGAFKVVMHDMIEDDNERRERTDVGLHGMEWITQTMSGFWNHNTWNRFRDYVETMPEVQACGLVEETKIRRIFEDVASKSNVESLFPRLLHPFGVKLTRVDDAILLLAPPPQHLQATSQQRDSVENDDDNPKNRMAWENAKQSGQLLLSLTYVQALMSQYDLRVLNERLEELDRKQREIKSFFDNKVIDRLSSDRDNNPWAPKAGVSDRAIEQDPVSGKFVVYHTSKVTEKIRFVGTFDTYIKAKIAFEQAERVANVDDEREQRKQQAKKKRKGGRHHHNHNNDKESLLDVTTGKLDDDEAASLGSLYDDVMDGNNPVENDGRDLNNNNNNVTGAASGADASSKLVEESDSILQRIAIGTYHFFKSISDSLYNWYISGTYWLWSSPTVLHLDIRNNWVDEYNNRQPQEKPISVIPLGFLKYEQILRDRRAKSGGGDDGGVIGNNNGANNVGG